MKQYFYTNKDKTEAIKVELDFNQDSKAYELRGYRVEIKPNGFGPGRDQETVCLTDLHPTKSERRLILEAGRRSAKRDGIAALMSSTELRPTAKACATKLGIQLTE